MTITPLAKRTLLVQTSSEQKMANELKPGQVHDHHSSADEVHDHQSSTDEVHDHQSGTNEVQQQSMATQSTIMGKLCHRVLALIKWKKGLSQEITEDMIRALEKWLHNRGISVYTDHV
jgi:hypothetical protein